VSATTTIEIDPANPPVPTDLPFDDGVPMDSPRHRHQMNLLIDSLETRWAGRKDFYCGGDMFIHFSTERLKNRDFRGPDFFVVLETDHDRDRKYWAVWEENGRYPNVIVELTSPTTEDEDRTTKKAIYERTFSTREYFLYRPDSDVIEGFRLSGRYKRILPDANGRFWCEELECWLGTWDGEFLGLSGTWLRFFEKNGDLICTGREAEAKRAEAEAKRAETEAKRATNEAKRAEAAEEEVKRLKAEIERLKSAQGR